jgi:AraC family transcriptional regulator of arabinose operon
MPEKLKNISQVNLRLRRGPVVFGDVLYKPGGVCGPRIQQDYQLVIMHGGTLELRLDEQKISVPAGSAILLSPRHRELFRFAKDAETHHSWCAIEPKAVPMHLRRRWQALRGPIPFPTRMMGLLELGISKPAEIEPNETLDHGYYLGLGLALLSDFALAVQKGKNIRKPSDDAMAKVDNFISRELARAISLADLARAAGVSRQYLLKLFRLRGMKTPMQYLYAKRLDAAAGLLSHTGVPIGEIAERCGFGNAFHFSRKFKEAYGKNPRSWRKDLWTVL